MRKITAGHVIGTMFTVKEEVLMPPGAGRTSSKRRELWRVSGNRQRRKRRES